MKKLLVLLTLGLALTGCSNDGCPEGYTRVYDKELVGCYELIYKLGDGTPVFELTTARGPEKVVGTDNLQYSLDVYRENGWYGKPHTEVIDPSEEK